SKSELLKFWLMVGATLVSACWAWPALFRSTAKSIAAREGIVLAEIVVMVSPQKNRMPSRQGSKDCFKRVLRSWRTERTARLSLKIENSQLSLNCEQCSTLR